MDIEGNKQNLSWSHHLVYALGYFLNRVFLSLWLVLKFVALVAWGFLGQFMRNPLGVIAGLAIVAAFVSRLLGV
ncbi:MAG: hypothetical protein KGQ59_03425 [Bdellovibrionales bacterium]|nr:hypothetical protein [Bdellovibrionales bacterium]